MAFEKGVSGNPNGRPAGSTNKSTQAIREIVQGIVDNQISKIETELNGLTGKEYISAITGLMEFVLPKLSRTDLKSVDDDGKKIIVIYDERVPVPDFENKRIGIALPDNGRD